MYKSGYTFAVQLPRGLKLLDVVGPQKKSCCLESLDLEMQAGVADEESQTREKFSLTVSCAAYGKDTRERPGASTKRKRRREAAKPTRRRSAAAAPGGASARRRGTSQS